MLKVYLAARFSRFDELNVYKAGLAKLDVEVTSRWLNGGHEWVGTDDDVIPVERNAEFAQEDLDDVDEADVLICFTESARSGPARGGRHVEFGWALAKQKPIIVVGHRENVFYCLPQVQYCATWGEALEYLQATRMTGDAIARQLGAALAALGMEAAAVTAGMKGTEVLYSYDEKE